MNRDFFCSGFSFVYMGFRRTLVDLNEVKTDCGLQSHVHKSVLFLAVFFGSTQFGLKPFLFKPVSACARQGECFLLRLCEPWL